MENIQDIKTKKKIAYLNNCMKQLFIKQNMNPILKTLQFDTIDKEVQKIFCIVKNNDNTYSKFYPHKTPGVELKININDFNSKDEISQILFEKPWSGYKDFKIISLSKNQYKKLLTQYNY